MLSFTAIYMDMCTYYSAIILLVHVCTCSVSNTTTFLHPEVDTTVAQKYGGPKGHFLRFQMKNQTLATTSSMTRTHDSRRSSPPVITHRCGPSVSAAGDH